MNTQERCLFDVMNELTENNPDVEYCASCKQPCTGIVHDEGIGPYEFWGAKYNDVKLVYVSDCCCDAVWRNGREYFGEE